MNDKKMLVCLKKGDFFIWDSRIVHCSSRALTIEENENENKNENDEIKSQCNESEFKSEFKESVYFENNSNNYKEIEFLRLVSFVTYSPKYKVKESISRFYKNRVDAFIDQMTLTHWPHEFHIAEEPIWEWRHILDKNKSQQLKEKKNQIKASLIGFNEHMQFVEQTRSTRSTWRR